MVSDRLFHRKWVWRNQIKCRFTLFLLPLNILSFTRLIFSTSIFHRMGKIWFEKPISLMKNYFGLFDLSRLVDFKTKSQNVTINWVKRLILSNLSQGQKIQLLRWLPHPCKWDRIIHQVAGWGIIFRSKKIAHQHQRRPFESIPSKMAILNRKKQGRT